MLSSSASLQRANISASEGIWIFELDPQGIINTYQKAPCPLAEGYLGHRSLPPPSQTKGHASPVTPDIPEGGAAFSGDWVGRPFDEVVTISGNSPSLSQILTTLVSTRQSIQVMATLPISPHPWTGAWILQPVLLPTDNLIRIVAVGYPATLAGDLSPGSMASRDPAQSNAIPQSGVAVSPPRPNHTQLQVYAPRINQITRNIRWTLDLETIRRRTVDGLGELFKVQRCMVCSYDGQTRRAKVAAEYRLNASLPPWLNQELALEETPYLVQAATASLATCARLNDDSQMSVLAVATRYQNQINGFILLYDSQSRPWTEVELGLITDLGDQVGTAITHARLFGESHALAIKLQQANANLMEKQREFQEAQRQAEEARHQAEEASRLKSEFLANTSHELRTPLNGMIGFLRLVLDGMADDPEEQQEFIQEAHKSALHLLNLINDVLDIAKIEAGKMQIEMGPVNLKELLADLENFSRPQAERKGLYFDILIPATRDEITLNGNYQRLLQVLLNLVGNAVKFTHEGGITISAEVKPQRAEYKGVTWPGTVKISVADTGIGVSLEKQDRLFQTFSQVDGERTRQYGGTGLGLTISQKLVEAMGGVVQFISMGEGLGSTVTFTALLYQEPVIIDKEPVYPSNS